MYTYMQNYWRAQDQFFSKGIRLKKQTDLEICYFKDMNKESGLQEFTIYHDYLKDVLIER